MKNKIVIITGASSGIGKALAYEVSKKGAKVIIAARREQKLIELQKELEKSGTEVLSVKTDVTSEADCKTLIDKTVAKFGKIDILINNAGISMRAAFKDLDLKVIKNVMDVNFWGTVYCTKYAIPYLLESSGSVVAVSSITGYTGLPARTGYASSKYAVHGFMESLRIEHLKTGLHVMVIAPSFTESDVRKNALTFDGSPQGVTPRNEESLMSSEDAAKIMVKAIIKRKQALVMTWKGTAIVFLRKVFPRFLDKFTYTQMKKEPNSPF